MRYLQARVAELEDELQKAGQEDEGVSLRDWLAQLVAEAIARQGNSLYPSIRELLLLGVPYYADLYRKTKVEEAVFETMSQEYQFAKVLEAKEIPTVKVLDPPDIPERNSFPPRTQIVLLGTALAFSCGAIWVFGRKRWEQMDPSNPGKVLAQEVFSTVKGAMPWASRKSAKGLFASAVEPEDWGSG